MGKFRFLNWRSFGNTHEVPNSTVNTKQVVNLGIVGRRRWAIESHFLVVQWMDFFISSHSSLSDLWCNIFIQSGLPPQSTTLCKAPVRARRNVSHLTSSQQVAPTDSGFVLLLLMSMNKKKNRLFYVRFKLVKSASQIQFSKTHFLRPGSITTTANLKQTCPNRHFPIPDQSQLTDLQTRLHTAYKKNSYRCKENSGQSTNGIYTVMMQYFLQYQLL